MATRNPTIKKNEEGEGKIKAPKFIKIEKHLPIEDEEDEIGPSRPVFKKAEIRSVYVEVGANLGSKHLKFGIHADVNSEDPATVKNRLYFECLGTLERHIKEMGAESGPFRTK